MIYSSVTKVWTIFSAQLFLMKLKKLLNCTYR